MNSKLRNAHKKTSQRTPWDAAFKAFFGYKVMVSSLLSSFLSPEILTTLDLSTLEPCPNNYLTKTIRQRFNDNVWRVKMDDCWFYCYIMLEFQRKSDKVMALRIAEYNALLIRALHKAKLITLDGDVPAIIPIVIYMGEGNWTARLSVKECRPQFTSALEEYQLQQKYILLCANRKSAGSQTTLAGLLFTICDSMPDQIESLVNKLEAMLKGEEYDNLRQLFMEMINYAILLPAGIELVDPTINFQEANEMFAARAKKWRQDVLNEGILIGMGMTEDKAKNWRQEVLNEGIAIGEQNMTAKAKEWRQEILNEGIAIGEKNVTAKVKEWQTSVAEKMLKAGRPRAEIIQFTEITDSELDKLNKLN